MQHYTTAPPHAAPGLDLFAAAWVERFTGHGGSMIVNPDGTGSSFLPVSYSDTPAYEAPPEHLDGETRDRRSEFDEGVFIGRTRELLTLLEMVPGGRDAVKAHVRTYPSFACQGGIVGVR